MKPAWDRLGADYKDSASVIIADVDCTAEGSGTCNKVGVQGYPTIKYYTAGDKKGKDYQGGRDYDELKKFVTKTLDKPLCDAVTKKGCAKNEIEFLNKMDGKEGNRDRRNQKGDEGGHEGVQHENASVEEAPSGARASAKASQRPYQGSGHQRRAVSVMSSSSRLLMHQDCERSTCAREVQSRQVTSRL
ncbi:protein disulfide isomerase [Ostreococcus tauri]|uniref:Protein disulfide isomerase n=1 Tax=Ostreococcus tauri TaxID=70448 RepID=A0A1Y5I787_OSTTA|nr:protein disulfide isomerase [Ostreococcus tauri]